MPIEITRAAIYARYSSHEQDGGESIDFQLTRCKEYVEKQGWALDEANIFIDRARSGTGIHRREAFNNILALAKTDSPPFDMVVSWHTSRFGRDPDQAVFNKVYLKRYGIDVKFVSQDIPDGHIGKLIERIYEWKDEADSILIGQNAFEGQREVTQKRFSGGGRLLTDIKERPCQTRTAKRIGTASLSLTAPSRSYPNRPKSSSVFFGTTRTA